MTEYGNGQKPKPIEFRYRVFYHRIVCKARFACLCLRFRATRWGHSYKWNSHSEAFVSQQTSSPRHIACPAEKGLVALGIIHLARKSKKLGEQHGKITTAFCWNWRTFILPKIWSRNLDEIAEIVRKFERCSS